MTKRVLGFELVVKTRLKRAKDAAQRIDGIMRDASCKAVAALVSEFDHSEKDARYSVGQWRQ